MPALDKTGPLGKGSLTGRGLGECTLVKSEKEFSKNWAKRFKRPYGRGNGRGRGRGMGSGITKW